MLSRYPLTLNHTPRMSTISNGRPARQPARAWFGGDDARGVLALARVQHDEPRLVEFAAIDGSPQSLLAEFGPSGAAKSRHYPFWHLATDGQGCGPRAVSDLASRCLRLRRHRIGW